MTLRITWDPAKDQANRVKHGLSFDEAARLFTGGADYLERFDEEHSDEEDRFVAVGPVARGLIVVVFVDGWDGALRIVSARMATGSERRRYERACQGERRTRFPN
ncbi:MAG: BrnT family toxin [Acidobacteria bacterium]|nr:BrnT family toxin [Acidobacteriota bacterium]